MKLKVGIVGNGWWPDAMYLPALKNYQYAEVVAIAGRNKKKTQNLAEKWGVQHCYFGSETAYADMLKSDIDVVVVASTTHTHYPIVMEALHYKKHVLCEKPMALNYQQCQEMATLAASQNLKHMLAFTYYYMPQFQHLLALVQQGYIGKPQKIQMQWYTNFGRAIQGYTQKFDASLGNHVAISDLGSHFIYLSTLLFGTVKKVGCLPSYFAALPSVNNEAQPYDVSEDGCTLFLQFEEDREGNIEIQTTYEMGDNAFGMEHRIELHGQEGSLYAYNDWKKEQSIFGQRAHMRSRQALTTPALFFHGARQDVVHHTYKDIFRKTDAMLRNLCRSVYENCDIHGANFWDGAYVQKIIDAALESTPQKKFIDIE